MPMSLAQLFKSKLVLGALGIVGVILVGSVSYYVVESTPPSVAVTPPMTSTTTADTNSVANPDLSFAVGGRVSSVSATVGERVAKGDLLASLDSGMFAANLATAQANLSGLTANPRSVDLAGKQTALKQAEAAVANTYTALPSVIADALSQTEDAVHSTDPLFGNLDAADYPKPNFFTRDTASVESAGRERRVLDDQFDAWNADIASLSTASSDAQKDAALQTAINRLIASRTFFEDFVTAVNNASPSLPPATVTALAGARTTVNSLVIALQSQQQAITNGTLAVESAQDALNLLQAGATSDAVAGAQAQVDAAAAALAQAEIVAPAPGTITAVSVKVGDVVSPNVPVIIMTFDSTAPSSAAH